MADHASLTDPNLHEPKGVAGANAGEVYVADGSGSGSWSSRQYTIYGVIADVSTAETVYVPIPMSGNVVQVTTVLENAITSLDATITIRDNASNSMGTITITQSGSAAGDVDNITSLTNDDVGDADYITIETDGGSTTASRLWFTVVIERDD